MSEDAEIHKRVLFNEDMNMTSGLVYPKSPILKSPKISKPMTNFPSSSAQGSPKIRHKSPATRHLSPHRAISKNKITYNWEDVNSIRKTQSTALSALKNAPESRCATASTPDFKVEPQSVGTESTGNGSYNRQRYSQTTRRSNLRLIFIILNCIILAAALIYLVAGIFLTIYNKTALIIVEYKIYALCVMVLYIEAVLLMILSLTQLYFIHRGSKKIQIGCSLVIAAFTISLAILQSNVQTSIQTNVKNQMISSIKLQSEVNTKDFWNYIQKNFKCCGAQGRLDWCEKHNSLYDISNSTESLGSYICRLPISCCIDDIDKIISSQKFINHHKNMTSCFIYPTPWNTHRFGCLAHVKREINYAGKLFRTISFGTAIFLLLSSATTTLIHTDA